MGFNLVKFRSALRLDLKDSGTLWSNAELDRCVRRAIEDFSRFMPLERATEITNDFTVTDESVTIGEDTDVDMIVDGVSIAASVSGDSLTLTASPDKPRPITFLITDANTSITDFTFTVEGVDELGYGIEEVFVLGGGLSQTSNHIFKTVTKVTVDSIAGNGTGDTLDIGVGSINDVWHFLDNKPIRPGSETVTDTAGTTTYTRDTDYVMDYVNGAIKIISDGDMAAETEYYVDYTKSRLGVNLVDIIPEFDKALRVIKVQYPADARPQQFVSFNVWNNYLYIGSQKVGESQEELTDKKHVVIYYEVAHRYPTAVAGSTIPDVFDEVICIGAGAYALLMKALQYEHQAVTDIAYVDDALDNIAWEMDAVDTELTNAGNVFADEDAYLLTGSLPNVVDYLTSGDDYIPTVNVAADVGEGYRAYAETCYLIVRAYEQKRADLLTEAARYIDKADAWNGEAANRIGNAGMYLEIASRWRQEGIERRNEFWSILRDKSEYRKRISTTPVKQPA